VLANVPMLVVPAPVDGVAIVRVFVMGREGSLMARSRRAAVWSLVGAVSAAMLLACGSTTEPSDPAPTTAVGSTKEPTVLLDFEGASGDVSTFRNKGLLSGAAVVRSVGGGRVTVEPRPHDGDDHALRFPDHDTSQAPRRAVLVVESPIGDTRLDPGDEAFEFGADFTLDSVSEGGSSDNGNNLVQRGLASDPTQYKLQVEHRRASCRIAGPAGQVVVSSSSDVVDGRWYTVTCARRAGDVTLTLRPDEGGPVERVSKPGATGALTDPADRPLVVGGKASATSIVVTANSDQFNGAVDNVFLRID